MQYLMQYLMQYPMQYSPYYCVFNTNAIWTCIHEEFYYNKVLWISLSTFVFEIQ